ncbi:MAG: AMP-binding protein [Planctomycetaceae bacterium]|jgi:olefin beta-lactone synthetase|nr:AMP-binding protein [Planctomycetaceae bacterium]MBT6156640.1 AMP-binding protein [Planctomycetaceae bacterium]MBT6486392.1 AMP-binding protein [Planctomycetaceae bacterium]MBT6495553.1 AMP-binding protein [Planctomycetaceae bacterium]
MNIAEILRSHAEDCPDEIALVDVYRGCRRTTTYGELEQSIGRTVALFRQSGLNTDDTVLLFHPMSAELYIALAAILRMGLTAMFIDPSAGRRYIDRCCQLLPPQALVASSKAHLLRLLSPALRRIPLKFSIGGRVPFAHRFERAARLDYDDMICSCESDQPALASFTSGSTGEPKAALRTHGFLLAQHRAIEESLGLTPGEVELVTLPIFVLANLASRVTSIIADADLRHPAAISPEPVVAQICESAANRAAASPAFFERVVDFCEERNILLPTLQKLFTGGGPVSPQLLDRLQQVAPNADIMVVYGSTEAEPISTIKIGDMEGEDRAAMTGGRGLLAGQPVPSLDVRIMNDRWGRSVGPYTTEQFDTVCQPVGETGEIVVSGDHVLSGYLHGQGEDENKFCVAGTRWHRTGDAGYFDSRGRLWLLGRSAARVDDDRGALYPLGVEQAALRHPHIRQAAMVAHRGQRVLAVTLSDQTEQPDLASLLKSLSFASVDSIRILKRLPVDRRHNSKIDYPALYRLLEP